jgi:hypothetical protein
MDFVKVIIRCRCGEEISGWCVRVARNVPTPLRCQPGTRGGGVEGGGSRGIFCPKGHRCFDSPEDLERAVDTLASRGGWGRWQREGAVLVAC